MPLSVGRGMSGCLTLSGLAVWAAIADGHCEIGGGGLKLMEEREK